MPSHEVGKQVRTCLDTEDSRVGAGRQAPLQRGARNARPRCLGQVVQAQAENRGMRSGSTPLACSCCTSFSETSARVSRSWRTCGESARKDTRELMTTTDSADRISAICANSARNPSRVVRETASSIPSRAQITDPDRMR
jgi:hypothetical protein